MNWRQLKKEIYEILDCNEISIYYKIFYLELIISIYKREHNL